MSSKIIRVKIAQKVANYLATFVLKVMLIRSRDDLSTYAGNIRILCLHFAFEILFTFAATVLLH